MKNFVTITQRIVGRGYELGKCDCLAVVLEYLVDQNVIVPIEFAGITKEDYPEFFRSNPEAAKRLMVNFIDSFLIGINPVSAFVGDILLLEIPGYTKFLAICAGNGQGISATEKYGVGVFNLKHYKIVRAWKCPN